jgi:hypothetical protein
MPSKRANVIRKLEAKKQRSLKRRKEGAVFARFMGIEDELQKLPADLRGMLLSHPRCPKPRIVVDPASRGGEMDKFEKSIGYLLSSNYLTLESPQGQRDCGSFTLEQFFTVGLPIAMNIVGSANVLSESKRAKKEWVPIFEPMADNAWGFTIHIVNMLWEELVSNIFRISAYYSRLNSRIYWFECTTRDQVVDLEPFVVTLYSKLNQEERVVIEGQERRVFPVAWGVMDYSHASMDAALFGGEAGKQLPVYVQSHALHKLEERLPHLPLTEYFLALSVTSNPIVKRKNGGDEYLIQCSIKNMKVGYFVARVVGGKVIVQTFLFLTMQGTPEAKALYDRLRLRRYDIEKLKLDNLRQFVETDIFDDEDLKHLLTECGCGDLAQLREMIKVESYEKVAESLKQTLKIDNGKEAIHKPKTISENLRNNLQNP